MKKKLEDRGGKEEFILESTWSKAEGAVFKEILNDKKELKDYAVLKLTSSVQLQPPKNVVAVQTYNVLRVT